MEDSQRPPILGTPPEGTPVTDVNGRSGWADGEGGIRFPPGPTGIRYHEQAYVESPQLPQWHGSLVAQNPFGYFQPPAGPPPVAGGLSVASLVCGIVGSVLGLIPILALFALASGLVGFVLGAIAYRRRSMAGTKKTMPMWGVALSGLACLLGVIGFVIVSNAINDVRDSTEDLTETLDESQRELECADRAQTLEETQACFSD